MIAAVRGGSRASRLAESLGGTRREWVWRRYDSPLAWLIHRRWIWRRGPEWYCSGCRCGDADTAALSSRPPLKAGSRLRG